MDTIRDIYLTSGGFLNSDLVNGLITLNHWIRNDFQILVSQRSPIVYTRLRNDISDIFNDHFFDSSDV